MKLEFIRTSKYSMGSTCGRYSVSKIVLRGVTKYEAWLTAKVTGGFPKVISPGFDDYEDAIKAAQQYEDEQAAAAGATP